MKFLFAALVLLSLLASAPARERGKAKKPRSSVPNRQPAIIQMAPGDAARAATGLYDSALGGRELGFLRSSHRAGRELVALAELPRRKGSSEQIIAVAGSIVSTQDTEAREIARLAEARHLGLGDGAVPLGALSELAGAKFEKAWIDRLIEVNEESVAAYESGAKCEDAEIRSFAEKMLPVAQARLQIANRLGGRPTSAPARPEPAGPDDSRPRPIPPPVTQQ